MILFGCLLAFGAAVAPRVILVLAWIFSDRWPLVWEGDFLVPLLGILLLPYTTIMYMLAWQPTVGGGGGVEGIEWLWVLMGLFLDLWKYSQMYENRKQAMETTQQYYPSGAPRSPTGTGFDLQRQVPPSTSPTAMDADRRPPLPRSRTTKGHRVRLAAALGRPQDQAKRATSSRVARLAFLRRDGRRAGRDSSGAMHR